MNRTAFLLLLVALCIAQAGYAQPIGTNIGASGGLGPGGPFVQNMASTINAYSLPQQENYQNRKFPGFLGRYNATVKHGPTVDVTQVTDGTQRSEIHLLPGDQYKQKVVPATHPTRIEAVGRIWPDPTCEGRYIWDGRAGCVPNPTLVMPGFTTDYKVTDSGYVGPYGPMLNVTDPSHNTRTTFVTNMEYTQIEAARGELTDELRSDPKRWRQAMNWAQQAKQSLQGSIYATSAEQNLNYSWSNIAMPLINIANEFTWTACDAEAPSKTYGNSAWMVGQMYKQVYVPMAILLLLPGAVLTNLKATVRQAFSPDAANQQPDSDSASPFSGILRAMIAIFLIPATQLLISYTIDVGNSLSYEIVQSPYWNLDTLASWRDEQTYDPKFANEINHIIDTPIPESPDSLDGKARDKQEEDTRWEIQNYQTTTDQQWFNTLNALLGQGVLALNAFQIVIIMYLFLLGPVAAALYAWPDIGQDAFRWAFSKWMDGVVLVTMWKFWWALIMLAMMVRLAVNDSNYWTQGAKEWNDQYEMYFCAAFCGLLMYVPFNPFDFRPGDAIQSVLDQAQQQIPKGGATSGVSSGGTGPGGGKTGGGMGGQGEGPSGPGGTA